MAHARQARLVAVWVQELLQVDGGEVHQLVLQLADYLDAINQDLRPTNAHKLHVRSPAHWLTNRNQKLLLSTAMLVMELMTMLLLLVPLLVVQLVASVAVATHNTLPAVAEKPAMLRYPPSHEACFLRGKVVPPFLA